MGDQFDWAEIESLFSLDIPRELKEFYDPFPVDLMNTGFLIKSDFYPISDRCFVDTQKKLIQINQEARLEEDPDEPLWPNFMFAIGLDGTDFYAINTEDFDGRVFYWNYDEHSFRTVARSLEGYKNDLIQKARDSEFGHSL